MYLVLASVLLPQCAVGAAGSTDPESAGLPWARRSSARVLLAARCDLRASCSVLTGAAERLYQEHMAHLELFCFVRGRGGERERKGRRGRHREDIERTTASSQEWVLLQSTQRRFCRPCCASSVPV